MKQERTAAAVFLLVVVAMTSLVATNHYASAGVCVLLGVLALLSLRGSDGSDGKGGE